jgi:hypothetical protein
VLRFWEHEPPDQAAEQVAQRVKPAAAPRAPGER